MKLNTYIKNIKPTFRSISCFHQPALCNLSRIKMPYQRIPTVSIQVFSDYRSLVLLSSPGNLNMLSLLTEMTRDVEKGEVLDEEVSLRVVDTVRKS